MLRLLRFSCRYGLGFDITRERPSAKRKNKAFAALFRMVVGIRVDLNVRVVLEMRREAEEAVVVFGKRGEFVRGIYREAFAIVDDLRRVFRIYALFRKGEFRQMDVKEFGASPGRLKLREDERKLLEGDGSFGSKRRIAFRLGIDHVFQHGFPVRVPESSVEHVHDRVGYGR